MIRLLPYVNTKVTREGVYYSTKLKYTLVNDVVCGHPYTWFMGFGFEEWVNGKYIESYAVYYNDNDATLVRPSMQNGRPMICINNDRITLIKNEYKNIPMEYIKV